VTFPVNELSTKWRQNFHPILTRLSNMAARIMDAQLNLNEKRISLTCILLCPITSDANVIFSLLVTEIHNCRHFPILVSDFSYHKFNMTAAKPEVLISRAVYWIAVKFQRLHLCFQGQPVQWHAPRCCTFFPVYVESNMAAANRK
jgi:hypothetical protein